MAGIDERDAHQPLRRAVVTAPASGGQLGACGHLSRARAAARVEENGTE